MANFTAGTSFSDGVTNDVTALKLNALVADAVPTSNLALTSTNGTIANFTSSTANITLGTIPTLTAGTTTGTAGIFTSGTITTGLIPNLTTGTTTSTNEVVTNGTITNLSATTSTFLGTITGSTNVVNIGGGQIYKDASGNVGIGVTSPTAIGSGATLDLRATSGAGIGFGSTSASQFAQMYVLNADSSLRIQNTSASGFTSFTTNGTERLRIDSSGRVGINVTSPLYKLQVDGDAALTDTSSLYWATAGGTTRTSITGDSSGNLKLQTGASNTERMRIESAGNILLGKSTSNFAQSGVLLSPAINEFTVSGGQVMSINRTSDDGSLVVFYQDGTGEGSISVSGNTVSYNPFAGSHWSQLEDGSRPEILRGTVLESINQLCQWPDGGNERFAKCKISDTIASNKVYGVFLDWDNDWTQTNDLYVTAVGLFVCRINASVTVQIGDLLESNGDGTARVQADNVIRSSTIGKVTSSIKTHEHPDGSYCVPTVLYCG